MGKLFVKNKQIVVPGELIAKGMDYIPVGDAYRDGEDLIASRVSLIDINGRVIKLIPLRGTYIPKKGDIVIGRINEVGYYNWLVDIGYAYDANLSVRDATSDFIERGTELSRYYDLDEYIVTRIISVTKFKAIDLTMKGPGLKKLVGGIIINVIPQRIPRIVGKKGSMINLIKELTNCQIIDGQNGRIWIRGKNAEDEMLAIKAIRLGEEKAHTSGLTDEIKNFLMEAKKGKNV